MALLLTLAACEEAVEKPVAPSTPSGPSEPAEPPTPPEPAEPTTPTPTEPTTPTEPSDPRVETINPQGTALSNEIYTLELGTAPAEVFVISTNTTIGNVYPTIERLDSGQRNEHASQPRSSVSLPASEPAWLRELQLPPRQKRSDEATDHNQRLAQAQIPVAEGDRFVFIEHRDNEVLVPVPATARKVIRAGSTALAVWVADHAWRATCFAIEQCLTQEMVDALATRFLRIGDNNDIYDWVTNIFGAPWGPHPYTNLIPSEAASEIHILLLDIESDGTEVETFVLGYYHSIHNVLSDPAYPFTRASAQRLIFFMDSALLSIPEGPTWEVTDRMPSWIVSTLAHEFQHMIHFYQKTIVNDLPLSETWLNEMASEVASDLIADKLGIPGPRGVAYNDPTAGVARNIDGRLPLYNLYNGIQVTKWDGELKNYSVTYALGAYLARNYGGAALFREIVQNDSPGDVAAIEAALATLGYDASFADVLTNWAIANMLSDDTAAPHPYRYNSGTWFTSAAGGQTFRLGSIDLFNYRYEEPGFLPLDGPYLYSLSDFTADRHPPLSNRYATLGRATGTVRLRITASAGNRITVVVKE